MTAEAQYKPDSLFDQKWQDWHRDSFVNDLSRWHQNPITVDSQGESDETFSAQKAKELFLFGYLQHEFTIAATSRPGIVRVLTFSRAEQTRDFFEAAIGTIAPVSKTLRELYADIPRGDLSFRDKLDTAESQAAIMQSPDDLAAYFSGLWKAKELKRQISFPNQLQDSLVLAIGTHLGPDLLKVGTLDKGRRPLKVVNEDALKTAILSTESVRSLPFADKIFPQPQ